MKIYIACWTMAALLLAVAARAGEEPRVLEGHTGSVMGLAFSPDGKTLATSSRDTTIILWDVASAAKTLTLKDHTGHVYAVAFSPNGNLLASCGQDRVAKLRD